MPSKHIMHERKGAWVGSTYDEPTSSFRIGMISVPVHARRQGIGSLLMDLAMSSATQEGAKKVTGTIYTTEGLEFFRNYFGSDGIRISSGTEYAEERIGAALAEIDLSINTKAGEVQL